MYDPRGFTTAWLHQQSIKLNIIEIDVVMLQSYDRGCIPCVVPPKGEVQPLVHWCVIMVEWYQVLAVVLATQLDCIVGIKSGCGSG